jgi:hypothetical protein
MGASMSPSQPGQFDPEPFAERRWFSQVNRRELLKGGAGGALLFMAGGLVFGSAPGRAATPGVSARFFVYGLPAPTSSASLLTGAGGPTSTSTGLSQVAGDLAAPPLKSPDGSTIALVSVNAGAGSLAVALLDSSSGTTTHRASVPLVDSHGDSLVIATPVFSADSSSLALVVSISTPSNPIQISKPSPSADQPPIVLTAYDWTTHHEVAYVEGSTGVVAGAFDLQDAPSLARVNVAASASDFYVWSSAEPVPSQSGPVVPALTVFPLGSGTARFTTSALAPWPVSGQPALALPNGDAARLVYGQELQIYSSVDGSSQTVALPALEVVATRPDTPSLQLAADGTLLIANARRGAAIIAATAGDTVATKSVVSFPPPAAGGSGQLAVLSPDAQTLYVVGGAASGGLSAYDAATGRLIESQADDVTYTGVYVLADGSLLATTNEGPSLAFFSDQLQPEGTTASPVFPTTVV